MKQTGRFTRAKLVISLTLTASLMMLAGCAGSLNAGAPPAIPFTVTASPGAQTVKAGQGAAYAITVTPAAMIGAVNLSTSVLPAGVTASFGQEVNVLQGQKTL